MKGRRWRDQEDALLKKTVLDFIGNGKTQLSAFAVVGEKIGRTAGACGFRWNAVLRQQDPSSYKTAKKKRVYNKLQEKRVIPIYSLSQALEELKKVSKAERELRQNITQLDQQLDEVQTRCAKYRLERRIMLEEQQSFTSVKEEIKNKYQDLLQMIEQLELQNSRKTVGEPPRKQTIADNDLENLT